MRIHDVNSTLLVLYKMYMIVNLDPQVGQSDINIGSFLNKFVILVHYNVWDQILFLLNFKGLVCKKEPKNMDEKIINGMLHTYIKMFVI